MSATAGEADPVVRGRAALAEADWDEARARYEEAAGDVRGAARMAMWLASDHFDFRGDDAVAAACCAARRISSSATIPVPSRARPV